MEHFTDYYNVRGNGVYEYSHTVHEGTTLQSVWIPDQDPVPDFYPKYFPREYPGESGPNSDPADFYNWFNENREEALTDDRVINRLTGKAQCVFGNLTFRSTNLFKETIGAFIDDPEYNVILQIGECKGTDEGCTDGTSDPKNIEITLENVDQNSLGLAALILHEGLHAEMHRYVSRYESGVDPNNRARLLQLYVHYKGWADKYDPLYSFTNYAHHAYMVENYVERIASAVRQLDGNRFPLNYYMAYGWEGLEESGYAATRLTQQQEQTNNQLRSIVEAGFDDFCN